MSTHFRARVCAASLMALALGMGGCDEAAGPEAAEGIPPVATVSGSSRLEIRPKQIRLEELGMFGRVHFEEVDDAGNAKSVAAVFSSSASNVVSVDWKGWIKARKNGNALIIARFGSAYDTAEVYVGPATSGTVVLSTDEDSIPAVGGKVQVSAEVLDQKGVRILDAGHVWSTSTPSVLSVSGSDKATVTAVGLGKGELIATHRLGADTAIIWVGPKAPPSKLSLDHDVLLFDQARGMWMVKGEYTENGVTTSVVPSLTSSRSSVIEAKGSGWIKVVGNGTAKVVGMYKGSTDTIDVQVGNIPTGSFSLVDDADSLSAAGDTLRLGAEVLHTSGAPIINPLITWKSLNPGVATVTAAVGAAKVTAVGNGEARIVATRGSFADTAVIRVGSVQPPAVPAASIVITPSSATITTQNGTVQLSAQVNNMQAALDPTTLNWTSLDASIATVTPGGLVTAVANGSAKVRVTYGTLADTAVVQVSVPSSGGTGIIAPATPLKALVEEVIGPVALPPGAAFDSLLAMSKHWSDYHWTAWRKDKSYASVHTINYYDFAALMYYLGALTGDAKWALRADTLVKEYCAYACKPGQMVNPHQWQPRGVEIYARRTKDPVALNALELYGSKLARQLDGTAPYGYFIGGDNPNMDSRQVARSISSVLAAIHTVGRGDLANKIKSEALPRLEAMQALDATGARWIYNRPINENGIFHGALVVHAIGDAERRGFADPRIVAMSDRWLDDAWTFARPTRNCQGQVRTTLPYDYNGGTPKCYHHTLNGINIVPFAQRYARTHQPAHLQQVMDLLYGSLASETWDAVGKQFMEVARTLWAAGIVGRAQGY